MTKVTIINVNDRHITTDDYVLYQIACLVLDEAEQTDENKAMILLAATIKETIEQPEPWHD